MVTFGCLEKTYESDFVNIIKLILNICNLFSNFFINF